MFSKVLKPSIRTHFIFQHTHKHNVQFNLYLQRNFKQTYHSKIQPQAAIAAQTALICSRKLFHVFGNIPDKTRTG